MSDTDQTIEPETEDGEGDETATEPEIAIEGDDDDALDEGEPEPETAGDDEGGEDEPEADVASGPTDIEIQKALDKIEKRAKTYAEFVSTTAGEVEQPLLRCPVCIPFVPGFIFDPAIVPLGPPQQDGARFLLGEEFTPHYVQAPNAATCPTCNGWGKVQTGSRVTGKALIVCSECRGIGFVGEAANITPAMAAGIETTPLELVPAPEVTMPDEDQWGTPRGHPDFGVMPQYREPGWAEALAAFRVSHGLPAASA